MAAGLFIAVACWLGFLAGIPADAAAGSSKSREGPRSRPNVLIILADDMGWSDPGCFGGEIQTPNLDSLAANGLRFTQFYNTGRCWPTRGALLTGYYAQQIRRDTVPGTPSGGAGIRPRWARLLPELLRPLGYRSYHSGKWHIDGAPLKGGFDRSYRVDDHDRYFTPRNVQVDDVRTNVVPSEGGFYLTSAIADHAIECLRDHGARFGDRPFFHFLCFTAPHFPLQAPAEDIARYTAIYRAGWDELRQARWERIRKLKVARHDLPPIEPDLGPPYHFPDALIALGPGETNRPVPWTQLSPAQADFQAGKMAIHAAMVDRMDREIGRVLEQVRAMGAWDDTLILFLSDNGASAEIMVRGDGHDPAVSPGADGSYLSLGPGWSSVANTPFRRHKTWMHEGGISTPLIVHWSAGIAARRQGGLVHAPGHVVDLAPTVLALAGGSWPLQIEGQPVPATPGIDLTPLFAGARASAPDRECLWWLHEGNRAIRLGPWKLVAAAGEPWELYDLRRDRGEVHDLAGRRPRLAAELGALWERQAQSHFALALQTGSQNADALDRSSPARAPSRSRP